MDNPFRQSAGISLAVGAVLATLTMALHPVGGALADIAYTKNAFIFSHGMAIFCIPFIAFGFWGLSTVLQSANRLSYLAFSVICFGLVAAMMAGAVNGLVLPSFASQYANSTVDTSILHPIRTYGNFINLSLDYIFIIAISLSILLWSYLIVAGKQLPVWLGYLGIVIVLGTAAALIFQFNFTSVHGFRLYVFSIVCWKISAGVLLFRSSTKKTYE